MFVHDTYTYTSDYFDVKQNTKFKKWRAGLRASQAGAIFGTIKSGGEVDGADRNNNNPLTFVIDSTPMLSRSPTSVADRAAMATSAAALPAASRGKRSLVGGSGANETKRRASTAKWTAEEDAQLCNIVNAHSAKDWKAIASHLPGRTDVQCLHRWKKVLRPGLKKGELCSWAICLFMFLVVRNQDCFTLMMFVTDRLIKS